MTRSELALVWLALFALAALAFIPHIRHGGFYLDDWSNGALSLQPAGEDGLGAVISDYAEITLFRPMLVLYVPLQYFAFGMDQTLHLIWTAFLGVVVSGLLYGVLRTLGVPWLHALLIAGLVLVYPWSDSLHLWTTAAQLSLSIAFFLGGCWIALANLSRKVLPWHLVAAAFFLTSILTYEFTLAAVAAFGLVYVLRGGWATAKPRWAIDLAAAIAGALWVGSNTTREKSSLAGNIDHLGEIVEGGAGILSRSVVPLHTPATLVALGLLALVFGAGLAVLLRRRSPDDGPSPSAEGSGWGLRSWLLLGAGGIALVVLGWTMFIPADPYYTPAIYGITNRVNGLAGIGAVIAVYAALGVIGSLAGLALRRFGATPVAVTLLLAFLLGAGYVTVLRRHVGIWNSAWTAESIALEKIETRYPRLPEGSTLFVSGYPGYQTLGVPILSSTWDLDGMIKTRYEDGTLRAYPVLEGYELACGAETVDLESAGEVLASAPYGTARLFDLAGAGSAQPRDRRQCQIALGRFKPGPFYLSYDY